MLVLKEYKNPDGWNTVDTGITSEEWLQLLSNEAVIKEEWLKWILRFYREPGHQASCGQLAKKYKVNAQTINAFMTNCGRTIQKHLHRFTITYDEGEGEHFVCILVNGKYASKTSDGYIFRIREELAGAIEQLLYERLFEAFKEQVLPIGLDKKGIDEIYKWQLISDCASKTDMQILQRLLGSNLIDNQFDGAAIKKLLQSEPEDIARCFAVLRGPREGLQARYEQFKSSADALTNGRWKYSVGDERMAGAFLACADPGNYTFYKYDVYMALCAYLGIPPLPSRKILPHFYNIIDDLLAHMKQDVELMEFFEKETSGFLQSHLLSVQTVAWYMKEFMTTQSSTNMRFTWVPFMHELAEKLYGYKDDRDELINLFYGLDRSLTGAYQEEGKDIEDITPFTILGSLTIGTLSRKNKFATYYKKVFSMETDIPSDYEGLPSLNPQKSMFIYGKNKKAYTQCFWDLLGNVLNDEDITASFNQAISVKGTYRNLSMGLFWIAPEKYFSMDGNNEHYLVDRYGFSRFPSKKNLTGEYYLALMDEIRSKMDSGEIEEKTFLEFSANAYAYDNQVNASTMMEDPNPYYEEITDALRDKKSIILQGAPGTGKTYAIPEIVTRLCAEPTNTPIDLSDRDQVMAFFDRMVKEKRVVFTTFHQSMDYEDFVEGLKPVVENETVRYRVEDGIFKTLCEDAGKPIIRNNSLDLNDKAVVWKVSLSGTYDNEVRSECLQNGHIRIGWDDYGEYYEDQTAYSDGGKFILEAYYNKMTEGDIVFSCYSSKEIDAIGVVEGDVEWHDEYAHYKRLRKVRWLVKGIREDITGLTGKTMTPSTVYRMNSVRIENVLDLLKKYSVAGQTTAEKNTKPYVIVIDEINRGNVSKIFGELITLLEPDKRADGAMRLEITLPYSKTLFVVPSNVYLIGTMNTADRSLTQFDYAMRRRFRFIPMAYNFVNIVPESGKVFQEELFAKVSRIFISNYDEYLKDYNVELVPADCFSPEFKPGDLWIGPSYFITKEENPDSLYNSIFYEIIPILEHYMADGVFIDEEPVKLLIYELKQIAIDSLE